MNKAVKIPTSRRTLKFITHYPTPLELQEIINTSEGWIYKTNMKEYKLRDKALVALTYLIAVRISEVLRLTKDQFQLEKDRITINSIKLSKSTRKDKPRKIQYREVAWLPVYGERSGLTSIVTDYLKLLNSNDKLFNFGRVRAYQIISKLTGEPCHFLRAYGENYLYDIWDRDLLAVADYVKVDYQTLQHYIRRSYTKFKPV